MGLYRARTQFAVSQLALPSTLLALSLLSSPCSPAAPLSSDFRMQTVLSPTVLSPQALSLQAPPDPTSPHIPSWFSEDFTIHGKRHLSALPPTEKSFMTRYEDGHSEGDIRLWKGLSIHVQFGEDTRHDPVSGAFIAPFGEAYRLSSPLRQR